jgi:hypothetical protein
MNQKLLEWIFISLLMVLNLAHLIFNISFEIILKKGRRNKKNEENAIFGHNLTTHRVSTIVERIAVDSNSNFTSLRVPKDLF